jgi:alkanesulfonate monooxygenase SsuD/methylene tetrahydromethanopterin reductase-like flavin-dependent oxidoreductase (luciferase family)
MLRLTARHADAWNARGTPAEAGASNARLDRLCLEVGRDPGSIVRSISPAHNLLASVDAFETGVAAYRAAGFSDFQIPWPRSAPEHAVLRTVARDVMPRLRPG